MSLNNCKISGNIKTDILGYNRKDKRDSLPINGTTTSLTLK